MKKAKKQEFIDDMSVKLGRAKSVVLTDYTGLSVAEVTILRNELRSKQVEYKVVKNTLSKRAAAGTEFDKLSEFLEGPTGMALSYDDAVAPAKALVEHAKKQQKLKIKVGMVEGAVFDLDKLKAIASLPSREALLSQMAAGFQAPATKMARLLQATVARLGYALTALEKKKGAGAA